MDDQNKRNVLEGKQFSDFVQADGVVSYICGFLWSIIIIKNASFIYMFNPISRNRDPHNSILLNQ